MCTVTRQSVGVRTTPASGVPGRTRHDRHECPHSCVGHTVRIKVGPLLLQNAGVRTTPTMAYSVARTSINVGQRDRGVEVIKEMELNGVRCVDESCLIMDSSVLSLLASLD